MSKLREIFKKHICTRCEIDQNERCIEPLCMSVDKAEEEIKKLMLSEIEIANIIEDKYFDEKGVPEKFGMEWFKEVGKSISDEINKKLFGDK